MSPPAAAAAAIRGLCRRTAAVSGLRGTSGARSASAWRSAGSSSSRMTQRGPSAYETARKPARTRISARSATIGAQEAAPSSKSAGPQGSGPASISGGSPGSAPSASPASGPPSVTPPATRISAGVGRGSHA